MKRLYEFNCPTHGIFEDYVEYTKETPCPECGALSEKIISTPRISLEGVTGNFPGAAMQFERKHRQKLNAERKLNS